MGTEVLRPHDLFSTSPMPPFHRDRRVNPNLTLVVNVNDKIKISAEHNSKKKANKSSRTKKPKKTSYLGCKDDVIKVKKLVNGHVTLLKRGDSLDSIVTKSNPVDNDIAISNGKRIGREAPETMVLKKISLPAGNMYAGSVIVSPSPRALPQPSFFNMSRMDHSASRDLRRLLRLE